MKAFFFENVLKGVVLAVVLWEPLRWLLKQLLKKIWRNFKKSRFCPEFITKHDRQRRIEDSNSKISEKEIEGQINSINNESAKYGWDPARYKKRAKCYERKKDYKSVIDDCNEALKLDKDLENEINPNLADAYFNDGNYSKAIEYYDKVIEHIPNDANAHLNKGFACYKKLRFEEAEKCYNKAIELFEKKIEEKPEEKELEKAKKGIVKAFLNKGLVYYDQGKEDDALKCYEEAADRDSECVEAYYNRGFIYFTRKDKEENSIEKAVENYEKALKNNSDLSKIYYIKPKLAKAYFNRGNSYLGKKNYDKAIDNYNKAIEYKCDFAEAYFKMGYSYACKQDYTEALKWFNKAVDLNPKEIQAWDCKGDMHHYKGELDNAIKCYSNIIHLDSKHANSHYKIAIIYEQKGEIDEAIEWLNKAINLDPEHPNFYLNMGTIIKEHKRDIAEAVKYFNKAIDLDPDYRDLCNMLMEEQL